MKPYSANTRAACAVLLLTLFPSLHAQPAQSADQANALKAQAEHFRIVRERGEKAYYQPRFDLSALRSDRRAALDDDVQRLVERKRFILNRLIRGQSHRGK